MPKRSRPSRLTSRPRPATTISRPVSLARVESARLSASAKRRAEASRPRCRHVLSRKTPSVRVRARVRVSPNPNPNPSPNP